MIFSLEALQAFHGDSLLLHVDDKLCLIDGGPFKTWTDEPAPAARGAARRRRQRCGSTSRWSATSTATTSRA